MGPMFQMPKNVPRSEGAAMSEMTPAPETQVSYRAGVEAPESSHITTRTESDGARRTGGLKAPKKHEQPVRVRGDEGEPNA